MDTLISTDRDDVLIIAKMQGGVYGNLLLELLEQRDAAMAEVTRLRKLLRRPAVWAAHAADPSVVAPECDCAVGSTCQRKGCCYEGDLVPENVRSLAALEATP